MTSRNRHPFSKSLYGNEPKTKTKKEPKAKQRCPDCGEEGERKGHQTCQYPQD